MDIIEHDPLLCAKLGLEKLPQKSTFYRGLERFTGMDQVNELFTANASLLPDNAQLRDYSLLSETNTGPPSHCRCVVASLGLTLLPVLIPLRQCYVSRHSLRLCYVG